MIMVDYIIQNREGYKVVEWSQKWLRVEGGRHWRQEREEEGGEGGDDWIALKNVKD